MFQKIDKICGTTAGGEGDYDPIINQNLNNFNV